MASKNRVIPGLGIHHPALMVSDLERSKAFYTDGLGFTLYVEFGEAPHKTAILNAGDDTYIEMMHSDQSLAAVGRWGHLALRVDDCEQAYQRALSVGAKPMYTPRIDVMGSEPGIPVKWAYVIGPDEELIEFCQYDLP